MNYKGKYQPKNPKKYKGNLDNIVWRSSWELKVMKYFDEHPNILEWSSEEIAIPYISPVDGRYHRYFPDFLIKTRLPNGNISTTLIEVKPFSQTIEPQKRKRISKQYLTEVATWGVNDAKWKSAREFCKDRNWNFEIITEKDLGIGINSRWQQKHSNNKKTR